MFRSDCANLTTWPRTGRLSIESSLKRSLAARGQAVDCRDAPSEKRPHESSQVHFGGDLTIRKSAGRMNEGLEPYATHGV